MVVHVKAILQCISYFNISPKVVFTLLCKLANKQNIEKNHREIEIIFAV